MSFNVVLNIVTTVSQSFINPLGSWGLAGLYLHIEIKMSSRGADVVPRIKCMPPSDVWVWQMSNSGGIKRIHCYSPTQYGLDLGLHDEACLIASPSSFQIHKLLHGHSPLQLSYFVHRRLLALGRFSLVYLLGIFWWNFQSWSYTLKTHQ